MESNYNFSKNSNHVKFFKWMWNVDPTVRFKTMCPYFWQYIGSIIILPIILLYKLLSVIMTPISASVYKLTEEKERNQFDELMLLISNPDLTPEEEIRISRRKCFKKFYDKLFHAKDSGADFDQDWRSRVSNIYLAGEHSKIKKVNTTQKIQDNLSYGWFGKVIATLLIGVLVYLIGWGGYELLHLFTWTEFVRFMAVLGGSILVILIGWGIIRGIVWIVEKLTCETPLKNVVFWRHIGNFFVMVGKAIVYVIRTTFDMIGNFYKNQCPIIHWEDEK